mmetsp:Transcript_10774/g.29726  ORF Transcript_10774/g.29726 Transcript_10774/m.29726 type:complete len:275 (+) Transcript_10774:1339-2163(+)
MSVTLRPSVSYGTTSTLLIAKSILSRLAPIRASRHAFLGPMTTITCCRAPACNSPTKAVRLSPVVETAISKGRDAISDSRSFMPFLTTFCFFLSSIRSSTLPVNSSCWLKSHRNSTANNATAPKSIPKLSSSVFKLNSGLADPAMAPEPLMRPPRNAPEPKAPYKNKRNVRQGAMDSVSSLLRMFVSKPPFFFASLLLSSSGDASSADCCCCCCLMTLLDRWMLPLGAVVKLCASEANAAMASAVKQTDRVVLIFLSLPIFVRLRPFGKVVTLV